MNDLVSLEEKKFLERRRWERIFTYLCDSKWEWVCILYVPPECTFSDSCRFTERWVRSLGEEQEMSINYVSGFHGQTHPYKCLVAAGHNEKGESLFDRRTLFGQLHWTSITKQSALIEPVTHLQEVISHILHDRTQLDLTEIMKPYIVGLLALEVRDYMGPDDIEK